MYNTKWLELDDLYMQSKVDYGAWTVTSEQPRSGFSSAKPVWSIEYRGEGESVEVGNGKAGKKRARTLAAALEASGVTGAVDVIPPSFGPSRSGDDWEAWAGETDAVPVAIASAGKPAVAAWLKVVHREREGWIGTELGVSEATVRQYLSDLREGRR